MNQAIVYKTGAGGVVVVIPANCDLTVDQIAQKDVPAGKPYKIINAIDLPDRTQRGQWTVDDIDLTDGIGSGSNGFGA